MGWLLKDWLGNVCPLASEFQQAYNPRNCPLPQLLGWSSRFNGFRLSRLANSHETNVFVYFANLRLITCVISQNPQIEYMVAKWYIHVHYTAWDYLLSIGAAYSGLLRVYNGGRPDNPNNRERYETCSRSRAQECTNRRLQETGIQ